MKSKNKDILNDLKLKIEMKIPQDLNKLLK